MSSIETRLLVRMLRHQDLIPEDDLRQLISEARNKSALLEQLIAQGYVDQEWARNADEHIRRKARRCGDDESDLLRLDRSFGQIALARGWACLGEIEGAILEQQRLRRVNLRFRIGEILTRVGVLTPQQVQTVLSEQGYAVKSCTQCEKMINYSPERETGPSRCPDCSSELSPAQFLDAVRPDPMGVS